MAKKPIERKPISDAQLRLELLKLFDSGQTGKTNAYEQLRTRFKMEKQRCCKMFAVVHEEWAKIKRETEAEQIQANTKEALKSGLKSKIERIGDLQNQITELKQKLIENKDFKYVVIGGRFQKKICEIDLSTRAYIHKTIKDIEAEINKMEGNYAPAKVAQTDSAGNDIPLSERPVKFS